MMNTGFVCGVGSNLFGGNKVFPRAVPSFVWGDGVRMEEYHFKNFEETARVVMGRREIEMSDRYNRLLRGVFEETSGERQAYLSEMSSGS
jgi:hypothetical protein